jgi:hypothetical protein
MTDPHPTRLDQKDPATADAHDIREEADREIDAYAGRTGVVLLLPEDRWDEFLRLAGAAHQSDYAQYRGMTFRKAAVTAVVAEEGF